MFLVYILNGAADSQLKISLQDLLEADKKGMPSPPVVPYRPSNPKLPALFMPPSFQGRWWIVGAAWSGRHENEAVSMATSSFAENSKLMEIARQQRMSTDIRKSVFYVMMTSEVGGTS